MEAIFVWYFLTSGVAVIGPFSTQEQCEELNKWAYGWKYTSKCWKAPLAMPSPRVLEPRVKGGER